MYERTLPLMTENIFRVQWNDTYDRNVSVNTDILPRRLRVCWKPVSRGVAYTPPTTPGASSPPSAVLAIPRAEANVPWPAMRACEAGHCAAAWMCHRGARAELISYLIVAACSGVITLVNIKVVSATRAPCRTL